MKKNQEPRFVSLLAVLITLISAGASPGQSVVDYLNSKGHDSGFEARATLWYQMHPNAKYSGTAEQNTELLAALKRNDATPQIFLLDMLVSVGDSVRVKTAEGQSLLFESELAARSFESTGGTVELGKAKVGVFSLRVTDGLREINGQLFIWPDDSGKLSVQLFTGTSKSRTEGLSTIATPDEGTVGAFKKFFVALNEERFKAAAKKVGPQWIGDNISGLGGSFVACVVWPVTCVPSGGSHGMDLGASILIQAAEDLPAEELTNDEKSTVVAWIKGSNSLAQLGIAVRSADFQKKACSIARIGLNGLNSLSAEVEHEGTRMIVRVFIQQTDKVVMFACKKK